MWNTLAARPAAIPRPQPVATTHGQDDSVTPNKPVDPGLVVRAAPRRWASPTEAAEYFGVKPKMLRRMVAKGKVTGYRMGTRIIRYDLAELDALMRPIPTTKVDDVA